MKLGQKIKFVRKRRHITQKELGLLVGFSERNAGIRITQYEKGKRQPKEEVLRKIADTLGVSLILLKSNHSNPKVNIYIDIYWTQMLCTNLTTISMAILLLKEAERFDKENYQIFEQLKR
ncbi:helix-turn-helix domain-containing protein [Longibaculum muris]|uniref:helix-turn-helix domain-containing protein n=1 Tax=Longibaculum muris TaxID=1796628 RepID=UPI001045430A|nr:helix-turn-helix transcriptional regulator [Longibaculum muris]